jgi:hypothetical protein
VERTLVADKGVLAGYDFGVTWDEVKKNRPKGVTEAFDDTHQLRFDDPDHLGENGFYVGFGFAADGGCRSIGASVFGNEKNKPAVAKVFTDLSDGYMKKYGTTECRSSKDTGYTTRRCTWEASGTRPRTELWIQQFNDTAMSDHVEVSLSRAAD